MNFLILQFVKSSFVKHQFLDFPNSAARAQVSALYLDSFDLGIGVKNEGTFLTE